MIKAIGLLVKELLIKEMICFMNQPLLLFWETIHMLANSYLGAYNANKESVEGIKDKLGSVTILAYKLNRNTLTRLCLHYPIGQSPVE